MSGQPVNNLDISVGIPAPAPARVQVKRQPGCLVQLIFFVFIGWWLGGFAVALAYILFALVITIPVGVKIINRIPYLMALRQPAVVLTPWGQAQVAQRNIILRTIWFILVGFWFAALWMSVAYLLCVTIIGMPLGFWMFDRTPAVLTLRRST